MYEKRKSNFSNFLLGKRIKSDLASEESELLPTTKTLQARHVLSMQAYVQATPKF